MVDRAVDEDFCSPLHYAAMEGSAVIAQMLFEAAEKKVGWVNVKSVSHVPHRLGQCQIGRSRVAQTVRNRHFS